jgi:cold shock CspA family protein
MYSSAVKAAKLGTLDGNQRIEFAIEEKQGKTSAINIKKINK